ncbi:hypothetical protein CLOM_g22625 [Closterium sp. NIES-68]|nr:hypothetical protein CLOM_g22625 [Closterium sp. NIES-68]
MGQLARVVQNPTEEQCGKKELKFSKRRGSSSEKERCSFPVLPMPRGLLSMRIHHQLVDTSAWWEVGL